MVKVKKCPNCGCVMKCTQWNFDSDSGSKRNHGDFDCRNCDHIENNIQGGNVITISGYSENILEPFDSDISFDSYIKQVQDSVVN